MFEGGHTSVSGVKSSGAQVCTMVSVLPVTIYPTIQLNVFVNDDIRSINV